MLANRREYLGGTWGGFELGDLEVTIDGRNQKLLECPINFHFAPAPGWLGHVERAPVARRA
jgi:hypothetical protein